MFKPLFLLYRLPPHTGHIDCDDEHDHIVDAIERHDEVAAENAMRKHINNAFIFKRANAELQDKKLNEV